MTDNKTLDLIIYRCENANRNSTFGLTLPPSFKSQSPFYQMRVLFSEHTAPTAFSYFSVLSNALNNFKSLLSRIKETQIHLSYVYQISHPLVKKNINTRLFALLPHDVINMAGCNIMMLANPDSEASTGPRCRRA